MINHIRTLLLNEDGTGTGFTNQPGDEFVPPNFQAQVLPTTAAKSMIPLLGEGADRVAKNYRLRQLMAVLHSTELEEFVLQPDPRITYDILPLDELFDSLFQATIEPLEGTLSQLFLVGRLEDEVVSGPIHQQWLVEVTSSTSVRVDRLSPPPSTTYQNYVLTENLSNLLSLTGSTLQFRVEGGIGSKWHVQVYQRPAADLGQVLADVDAITEDIKLSLFGVGTSRAKAEPWLTFRNLYQKHIELPYRLGAFTLAVGYYLDLLHKGELT